MQLYVCVFVCVMAYIDPEQVDFCGQHTHTHIHTQTHTHTYIDPVRVDFGGHRHGELRQEGLHRGVIVVLQWC
jgi:hypothetical protein